VHDENHAAEFVGDVFRPRYQRHRRFIGCGLESTASRRTPRTSQYSLEREAIEGSPRRRLSGIPKKRPQPRWLATGEIGGHPQG
jgi:hypothetical protein